MSPVLRLFLVISGCILQSFLFGQSTIYQLQEQARRYEQKKDTSNAIAHQKKVLARAQNAGLPEHEARALVQIARLLPAEEADSSLEHLANALRIARRIGHQQLAADIFRAIADIHKSQRNYREAIFALEEHHKLLDTLFARRKQEEVRVYQTNQRLARERTLVWTILITAVLLSLISLLYSRKLNRLNKELRALNYVKDRIFSIVSHDLRGPANNIAEALALVESGELSEADQKEMLHLLHRQSVPFRDTIDNLLAWALTQLKGAGARPTVVHPAAIVQQSWNAMIAQTSAKQLSLVNRIPPGTRLFADKDQLEVITRNLLNNAMKFSFENGLVETGASVEGNRVTISFRDSGAGMSEEKLQQFNSRGYVDSSYGTRQEKGIGIGLALVKEFVRTNGGTIRVHSEQGRGTVFLLTFPVPEQA
ncbi:tetratricopeptide repeat-containing sensor histidine kinase [Sediminibacterium soli]|uniref:tetratricopeptide repeat-containing sensor histidine kinase n=1 Tax=Sediminibacterium soli TaxID=2698829 RepID=UPI00137A3965|nr:HAMP domain-containing sensor histidine kinase [Sediminibacterium soli]NCI46773.1 HAMP domain-containing histidine kinase [Sediminibacterium soli]